MNTYNLNLNQTFSGCEYLLIDAANYFGLDKEIFSKRISWAKENLNKLEEFITEADDPIMFCKAVLNIRTVQKGEAIGALVGLDATTSGVQILSALTGCLQGATWTNLVDSSKRYDCYTEGYKAMLENLENIECEITRAQAKNALMTFFYGSTREPEKEFGEGTEELKAFYTAMEENLPGAYEYSQEAKALWNPDALVHSWTLPDAHVASVKVMTKKTIGIEVDELAHHTFNFTSQVNEAKESDVSLVANTTHSIDGFVVREVKRRCNYNIKQVNYYIKAINEELDIRNELRDENINTDNVLSLVILEGIFDLMTISTNDLYRYLDLLETIKSLPVFEVLFVHDEFRCLPNYCDIMRYWYKEILAELAESDYLSQMFSEIAGEEIIYENVEGGISKQEMAALIRNSSYAIC